MDAGRCYFNVLAIAKQTPEKPLRDGTAANVSGTDKENAFHDLRAAGRATPT
jgi:hypothetical protein